jgi:hypothetical protein
MSHFKSILDTIEKAVNRLGGVAVKRQEKLFRELILELKKLETRGDTLVNNLSNLSAINKIKVKLEKLMVDDKYQSELKRFAKAFDQIQSINQEYFSQFATKHKKKDVLKVIRDSAVETTLTNLTETGLSVGVTEGLRKILLDNVTTGGSYSDMTEKLRTYLLGDATEKKEGAFERYVKAYSNTAINQFSAEYNKAIADDLGLEWYMFDGSLLETSREFCIKAVQKKYIHVSEFETILRGDFGKLGKVPVAKKSGLPNGLMAGTTAENFVRRRGGWNCGHQMIAVDSLVVPDQVKEEVYATPVYKLWAKRNGKAAA